MLMLLTLQTFIQKDTKKKIQQKYHDKVFYCLSHRTNVSITIKCGKNLNT